jgi:hypothetical protein
VGVNGGKLRCPLSLSAESEIPLKQAKVTSNIKEEKQSKNLKRNSQNEVNPVVFGFK